MGVTGSDNSPGSTPIAVCKAQLSDMPAVAGIYNFAARELTVPFDTEERRLDEMERWFLEHGDRYPIFVAEGDGEVVEWASLSPFSGRCAYAFTVTASSAFRRSALCARWGGSSAGGTTCISWRHCCEDAQVRSNGMWVLVALSDPRMARGGRR